MATDNFDPEKIRSETEMWKKKLGLLQQQTVAHKTKLVEMIRSGQRQPGLLEDAEQYQNRFLQQDEAIRLMRNDIAELEKLLHTDAPNGNNHSKEIRQMDKRLSREIQALEMSFSNLNSGFLVFLSFGSLYF